MDFDLESEDWQLISAVEEGIGIFPNPKSRVRNPGLPCPVYSSHPRVPAVHRLPPVSTHSSTVASSSISHSLSSSALNAPEVTPVEYIDSLNRDPKPVGGKPLPKLTHTRPPSLLPADSSSTVPAPVQPPGLPTGQSNTQTSKRWPVNRSRAIPSSQKASNSYVVQKLVETFMIHPCFSIAP